MQEKYRIEMLDSAKQDLYEMAEHLNKFYASTFLKKYDKIIGSISNLKYTPFMYEQYRNKKLTDKNRRIVVDGYLVFYTVKENVVEIRRIISSKRNIKKILK